MTTTTEPTQAELAAQAGATPIAPTGLKALRYRVELVDGHEYVVTATNPDFVRFDITRAKERWPAGSESPFLVNTFLAWAASKRAHNAGRADVPDPGDFDGFANERACYVTQLSAVDVDPSQPAPAPGS